MAGYVALLLGVVLISTFFLFFYFSLKRFKDSDDKIKYLVSMGIRKRRQMATYGLKPNPPYFRSQLRKQYNKSFDAQIENKERPSFTILLAYTYELYDPVLCVIHRLTRSCKKACKRKAIKRKQSGPQFLSERQALTPHSDLPVPRRHNTPFTIIQAKKQTPAQIPVSLLRPSRWFLVLQYIGGLVIVWFFVMFWLFLLALVSQVYSFGVFLGIALLAAVFACFFVILFYWYSYRVYVNYIKESFSKAYYTMLAQPLSKPRPTIGGTSQSLNLFALAQTIKEKKQNLVKSLDLGALFRKSGFFTQRSGPNSPVRKRYSNEGKYPSPLSSDRKMIEHRPAQSQRLYGLAKDPQIIQESLGAQEDQKAHIVLHQEGSAKNLLEHGSQAQIGIPQSLQKSDNQGLLSRGEYLHIRRNLNFRKQRVLNRGLFYLFIVALVFLILGLCVVGFFYASTILAVGSVVGFFFGSLFEIFAVRPLYLLIFASIRQLINKKRKKKPQDKPKEKKNPLQNAELMDEANYLASEKEKKKQSQPEVVQDQEQAQLLSPQSPPKSEKDQEQSKQQNQPSLQEKQAGGEEDIQHNTDSPVQTRRSGVNPPDSPFGTNVSGIPKKDTALFDREEPSFDRAANLLVTPKISTEPKRLVELNKQKIAQAQTGRRSDGKSGSPLASPLSLPKKAQSTQVLQPLVLPGKPRVSVDKSLVNKAEAVGSVSGGNRSEDGVIEFDVETAKGEEAQIDEALPIYFSGRKESGVPSKLDKIPDDGEVRREDIPEDADINEMMMNPLDDLCPYKKMITDIIYLSCGPEGGDQLMKRITKANDDIPLEDLQRIVEQNDYDLVKTEEDEQERVSLKPEVRPVIPIQETPQEDEEDTNSVHGTHRKNESNEEQNMVEVQEAKGEEAKINEEKKEKENKAEEEQDIDGLILAQSPRHFQVPESLRKAQEDSLKSEEKKYLSQSRKSQGSGIRGSTLSPVSQAGRTATRSPGAQSRKSPTGASIRSGRSGKMSDKSPIPHLSPRKVLMGAGLAPNTKGRPRGGKDRSLELDLGNMSASVVISGDRGGQTPPGIQGAQPFFLISQDGGQRGGYQKRGKGKKKKKSRKQLVEYDNGDREDSLEIDGTSVFFKQGQQLPGRSESEESFSEGDMVYYNKEDLTNYSRHLGLNKLKGPSQRFKNKRKMRHSFHPDLSSLSSEEEARRVNRSLMNSVEGRPLSYSQMVRRHQYSPFNTDGSGRVDCWNRDYEMLLRMGKTPNRRVSRLSASRKLSSNELSPLRVPVHRNSSFNRGIRQFYSLQPSQQRRGYLPPMSQPKKKKKKKQQMSRAQSQIRSSGSEASRMWIPRQMETADRMNNLSAFRRPSNMETLSTALRPQNNMSRASRLSRGSRQYSDDDELSPYAERMVARFKSWYPGKEDKLKRRKPSSYAKVGMLESLYGGPVEITGIGICGGIRPSQRRKWVKHHKALEIQRSHLEEERVDDFHPQPLIFGKRQASHRSSRSSVAFPEPPEASFNPNFYKYYESDSSGDPASNRFKFHPNKSHNSSFSPQQQQRRHKTSVDTLPSIGKKPKRQQFEPLFNPDSTDEKWVGEGHERPRFQSPADHPVLSSSESAKKSSLPPIKSPGSHETNSIQEL